MAFCSSGKTGFSKCVVAVTAGLALVASSACNTSSASKNAGDKSAVAAKSASSRGVSGEHGIDLNCVMDQIQNPPEAFHYVYNKVSSNPVHEQADITPQTIDGSFANNSGTRPLHGVRSDAGSWQDAWSGLMGIAGMSSAIALVKNASATVREAPEKVNGYDTVRYSIDTARGNDAEKGLYKSVLGPGGFEKGTAWVIPQGCPVKLVLDSELHSNDGSVETLHYEVAMVRK